MGAKREAGTLIVGGGEAGVHAAFALRERDARRRVRLVSREAEPPYERPPLSKSVTPDAVPMREASAYAEAGIECLHASVSRIDLDARRVALDGGDTLDYETLVIATGARARTLPDLPSALTLRSLADARRIRPHIARGAPLVVVGGGVLGLELAALARAAGSTVAVVEAGATLMARAVPAEIGERVRQRHARAGVSLHLGRRVVRSEPGRVVLDDGHEIEAALTVVAVGAEPETALAERAGLAVRDGIVVDERLRTSDPSVYAIGDCCRAPWRGRDRRVESWRNAVLQGEHVAAVIAGDGSPWAGNPWFWSDQYELGLQVLGLPDPSRRSVLRIPDERTLLRFELDERGALVGAAGIGEGTRVAKDIKLAERLMDDGRALDAAALADPDVRLKSLLAG